MKSKDARSSGGNPRFFVANYALQSDNLESDLG
jgi:hypothetical protein